MDRDKLIEDAQIEQNELDLEQEQEPDALEFDEEIEEEDGLSLVIIDGSPGRYR